MRYTYFILLFVFSLLALSACKKTEAPHKSWQEQVQEIDTEIEQLNRLKEKMTHQQNEEERQSLIYMRDDWSNYSKKMEGIERDHQQGIEIDKKINELKGNRSTIIEANKEANRNVRK